MNETWIFKDGLSQQGCTSFPYAFRLMYNAVKTGVEKGRKFNDMVKQMAIIAPTKDQHGDPRRYNYQEAAQMAEIQGFFVNGQIDSRKFKVDRLMKH